MVERPRTRVRACADDLHQVKDSSIHGRSTTYFYRLMVEELVNPSGTSFPLSVRQEIGAVRRKFGTVTYVVALLDWPARKIATRLKFLPEHGYWSDNKISALLAKRYRFPGF